MSGFNCGFLKGPDCSDVFDLLVMFFGVKTLRARVCVCFCFFFDFDFDFFLRWHEVQDSSSLIGVFFLLLSRSDAYAQMRTDAGLNQSAPLAEQVKG